ncbi:cytochrome ubiquinol oxidase subunit I, partial [Ralstonia pseudosolanacearum]
MLAVSWTSAWRLRRDGELPRWLARALVAMTFSGWVAVVAGWYVTEIGRQPWLVYGVLTTAQAASTVPATMIGGTLAMYLALYAFLIASYVAVVFYLARKAGGAIDPTDADAAGSPAIETPTPLLATPARSQA